MKTRMHLLLAPLMSLVSALSIAQNVVVHFPERNLDCIVVLVMRVAPSYTLFANLVMWSNMTDLDG